MSVKRSVSNKNPLRTYSLFAKEGTKWVRISAAAFTLETARRLFQSGLLGGTMQGVKMELKRAIPDPDNHELYKANMDRIFPQLARPKVD